MIGLDLDLYWEISPKQFQKYIDAHIRRAKDRAREVDSSNYNLGKYIAIGFHSPKKYPDKPFLVDQLDREEMESKKMSVEEMQSIAKKITYKLGGKVNG